MHFADCMTLAAVLFTTLIENLRLFFFCRGLDCSYFWKKESCVLIKLFL